MAASTNLGVTRPSSIDSPLMAALGNTAAGQTAERQPHPDLRLDQCRRQPQHQHRAWRQRAGGLWLQSQHGAARSGGRLFRAAARHGSEGSRRLGLPPRADLRRELSLHHGLRPLEQPASEPEQEQRLRHADGLWRGVHSAGRRGPYDPVRTLHLNSGHRGAARAEQLHVHALDDLHLRQLHQHRSSEPPWRRPRTGCSSPASSVGSDTMPWHVGATIAEPVPGTRSIPERPCRRIRARRRASPPAFATNDSGKDRHQRRRRRASMAASGATTTCNGTD